MCPAVGLAANRFRWAAQAVGGLATASNVLDDDMTFGWIKSSSERNPATEAFNRGQRFAPLFVGIGVLAAVLIEGVSIWVAVPFVIGFALLYALVFVVGARLVRFLGLKLLKRE